LWTPDKDGKYSALELHSLTDKDVFQKGMLFPFSVHRSWRWRHCPPLNHQNLSTQLHITSHRTARHLNLL